MGNDTSDTEANIGTEVDGFRITGVLGRGGMGVVYRAEDVALGRTVALKMIDPAFARDEHFLRRFRAEARALARINEPHIVQVHALRRTELGSFIVMECVDGGTLGDRLAAGPIPVPEALPIIRQMLLAFAHAHELGVVHRDIKPGNIMLTRDGMVKVTDFGLAKVQQGQPAVTVTQAVAGTLYYMSPEQVRGLPSLDHRSDLYAIGMTVYEMLAGRLPFERGKGEFETMRVIVDERFPPPGRFNAVIAPELSRIVMKALEKDPDRRYQSAKAMLADVDVFAAAAANDGTATFVGTTGTAGPGSVGGHRRALVYGGGAAAALLVMLVVVWLLIRGGGNGGDEDVTRPDVVQQATVSISTLPPGGSVRVDGRDLGRAPVSDVVPVDARGIRVQVQMEGYQSVDTLLYPQAGDEVALQVGLAAIEVPGRPSDEHSDRPPPGDVPGTLRLTMAGAGVARVGGRTFEGNAQIDLPPGSHSVQCGSPPHDLTTRVTVRSARQQEVTCYFDARITLITQMEDGSLAPPAAVWIDGEDTGTETPREIVRGPGTYTFTVNKFGYEVLNEERLVIKPTLEPQEPRRLVFRLRQSV